MSEVIVRCEHCGNVIYEHFELDVFDHDVTVAACPYCLSAAEETAFYKGRAHQQSKHQKQLEDAVRDSLEEGRAEGYSEGLSEGRRLGREEAAHE